MKHIYRMMPALAMLVFSAALLPAQKSVTCLDDGWAFRFPDNEKWTTVSVPHTFNEDAYRTRNYYKGKGEYLRVLNMPSIDPERRYFLRFDAANKAATLWVNGQEMLSHAGGYSAFCSDVTDALRIGENEIRVVVDNSRDDVAPLTADFTFWGGLYRDVWLISTPLQHFDLCDDATQGVYVSPTDLSEKSASLSVRSRLCNDAASARDMRLVMTLRDDEGNVVGETAENVTLGAGEYTSVETLMPAISEPHLWSPESPYLYTFTARLVDRQTGATVDETDIPVGFRWFSFDGGDGLRLNGKPCKLRGINRHQDLTPLGAAVDDEAHRRDMRLLKDLGCNFVRLAHYQQDDAILDACDRLGLIVWEEIPVVNVVPDIDTFGDNCEKNLEEMIRQHFNHPSVMMWGYMNEILLYAPDSRSPEWTAVHDRILTLARRLERKLRQEDPSRASVMAFHGSDRYNEAGLAITDVQGWNLYQGWYGGELTDFEKYLEEQHRRFPQRSLIVSEWGAGSDRRLHSRRPEPFDFSIEYQQRFIEHYLPYIEKSDYLSGAAYWNFIDFSVAERQESMPRVNNKGLFYNNRTPKDVAFYFKSMWRQDIPVVHIAVRDRGPVVCGNGSSTAVKVYSNCPEVELVLNGKSLGVMPVANCNAVFNVNLPEGISSLVARGVKNGQGAADAATIVRCPLPDIDEGETLAINVGSNCDFTSAVNGETWLADMEYSPGKWGYMNGKRRSVTPEIFGTYDTPLFQTMLEDITDYRIDALPGKYEVELLFTDINKAGNNSPYLLEHGSREVPDGNMLRMRVEICGKTVETDFSPSRLSGFQTAVRRKYIVESTDGTIAIRLTPLGGKTALSGISVRKLFR